MRSRCDQAPPPVHRILLDSHECARSESRSVDTDRRTTTIAHINDRTCGFKSLEKLLTSDQLVSGARQQRPHDTTAL
ncbi:hypothetical protein EVAR_86971_1 [Eumeta japonica]|uniref:Uncharacterized protein n=1 Tax=Eumeta variegata TaxID=151549 RepID=A0A4C1W5V3_EUMVA|nr:hypothetical protein EVAR_86971_1 [Eumeta japonica]